MAPEFSIAVTAVNTWFGGVPRVPLQDLKIKNVYVDRFKKNEESWYTLTKGDIEEDTQQRNLKHRKRGTIATSKVRAAITIANTPPGDVSFLPSSLFSKVSRLSNLGNLS